MTYNFIQWNADMCSVSSIGIEFTLSNGDAPKNIPLDCSSN